MKTFSDLKPNDKVWHTCDLDDWTEPELVEIVSIEKEFPLMIQFNVKLKNGIGSFIGWKNKSTTTDYHIYKEDAIKEMYRRWSEEKEDIQNHINDCQKRIDVLDSMINPLKEKHKDLLLIRNIIK